MPPLRHAALGLLMAAVLAPALAAQGRGGGFRGGRRGAASDDDTGPSIVGDLYRAARQSIAAMPTLLAPAALGDVARDEMELFPAQGLEDATSAFDLALALPQPESADDVVGEAALAFKQQVELNSVTALARRGDAAQALELARIADVPKAPLYDELILLAGRGQDDATADSSPEDAAAEAAAAQSEVNSVFDLVEECKRADGTYPYRGVAGVLRRAALNADNRMVLLLDGYQWASGETDPAQMNEAVRLLQAGHRAAPELDGELETALVAMVTTLGSEAATPFGGAGSSGNRVMALLAQVDAPQAESLAARYPDLGPQAMNQFNLSGSVSLSAGGADSAGGGVGLGFGGGANQALGQLTFSFSTTVRAGASLDTADASSEASAATEFLALLAQAESLQRRQPDAALALANQAAGMLDEALLANQTAAATRLAALYDNLGAHADGSQILARCLDAATAEARTLDANYLSAAPEEQAAMAPSLESAQTMVLEVFSLAARLDLVGTAERAETAQFVLLKPAVLARVALVAQVGMHPAPVR